MKGGKGARSSGKKRGKGENAADVGEDKEEECVVRIESQLRAPEILPTVSAGIVYVGDLVLESSS